MSAGLLAFTIALVASFGLTIPVRQLALRVGMVDRPGPRKIHLHPIPLLGGIAIYLGILLAMLALMNRQATTEIVGILAGATLVVLVGTLDDRGLLHHQIKLFVAMPMAGVILLLSGIHADVFSAFLAGARGAAADAILTVFWVTGITAAFSILDYMDGLCAGVAAVASFFFAVLAILNGQVLVGTLAASVMGAALGFLRWNFNPARIFMGDGGAMLLGFLMATLGLKLRLDDASRVASWMVPILVLLVPVFDTTLIIISRSRRGLLPFSTPGKDHSGHRLANCGLGTRRAVLLMYALGGGGGLVACAVRGMDSWFALGTAVVVGTAAVMGVVLLERAPYERQRVKTSLPS